jgi:hypothetical protein
MTELLHKKEEENIGARLRAGSSVCGARQASQQLHCFTQQAAADGALQLAAATVLLHLVRNCACLLSNLACSKSS